MKRGILLLTALLALALPSCTSIYGDASTGKFYAGSVLGRIEGLAVTPNGATAQSIDHDEANKSVRSYIYADAAKAIAGTLTKGWTAVEKSKQATERTGIAEKGLTDRAEISAGVEKARIEAEAVPFQ